MKLNVKTGGKKAVLAHLIKKSIIPTFSGRQKIPQPKTKNLQGNKPTLSEQRKTQKKTTWKLSGPPKTERKKTIQEGRLKTKLFLK